MYHPAFARMDKVQLRQARVDNIKKAKGMRGGIWDHLVPGYVKTARAANYYLCNFHKR